MADDCIAAEEEEEDDHKVVEVDPRALQRV